MRIGPVEVTFHRTVRVADGRTPSNLPPSLGRMSLHSVSKYRKNCPETWADGAHFMALHDVEAMWMSFNAANGVPVALLIGAGGINALDGKKLGTVLAKDNYLVAPPQPWLDGWKDKDGTVYQFVATPHKKGEGLTVGEQLIGAESKTGAVGIAVFEPKDPSSLKGHHVPGQTWGGSAYDSLDTMVSCSGGISGQTVSFAADTMASGKKSLAPAGGKFMRSMMSVTEMGVGKGGKIIQKIYPDPHGLEVWEEKPSAVFAVYLVDAATAEEITGEKVAAPATHTGYSGQWFGLQDQKSPDVAGTDAFSGLKSAAFAGDISNVEPAEAEEAKTADSATAKA